MKKLFLIFILLAVGCTKKKLSSTDDRDAQPGTEKTSAGSSPVISMQPNTPELGVSQGDADFDNDYSIGGTRSVTTFVVTDTSSPDANIEKVEKLINDGPSVALNQEGVFNFCIFPESLKIAVQNAINKDDCRLITKVDLSQIERLKIVYLNEEQVALLSEEYGKYFPKLVDLDVSNNIYMSVLPEFVSSLSWLEKLNISSTGIRTFNETICHLKNLTSLIASYNDYERREVPFNIFCLKTLKVLDMSYSSIRYIDEYIYKLENLEELYMRGNDLITVPFMLHTMSNLLLVDLAKNIFEPPPFWFSWLGGSSLNTLYNCKKYNDLEERQECQEEMMSDLQCEWIQKLPFERGEPFRQYKTIEDMGITERKTFEETKHNFNLNRCYSFWFINTFLTLSESEQEEFMKKTINGKTIREWKVVFFTRMQYPWWKRWLFCEQRIVWSDTSHLPKSQEILPHTSPSPDWLKDVFLLSWLFYEPPYSQSTGWEEIPKECIDETGQNIVIEEGSANSETML